MKKSLYISPMRSNAMIDELMTGSSIRVEGRTYHQLSRAPRGKRIMRRFINLDQSEKIVIYS
jgi:hypothetical protein